MRWPLLLIIALTAFTTACSGLRTYSRGTLAPLEDAFACAARELEKMGYSLALSDSVGGIVQGQREITGITETARRGAAAATEVLTAGLAGGKRTRYDQLTVWIYMRRYPQGNTVEVTAGMLTVAGEEWEQGAPSDEAKRNARALLSVCAPTT